MQKRRISIVSYLNSKPFLYGLTRSHKAGDFEIVLENPAEIVTHLSSGASDIGLVPVAGLTNLPGAGIFSKFCIGSVGKVRTVVLVSDVPLEDVDTVLLDYQSRSSVLLARILAKFYWNKTYKWENTIGDFHKNLIGGKTAGVIIGDRVFDIEGRYNYSYDLSEEWYEFTGLPFVFAVWASTKNMSREFRTEFDNALRFGIDNIGHIIDTEQINYPDVNISNYFDQNISFNFDEKKKAGMNKFLELAKKLEPVKLL